MKILTLITHTFFIALVAITQLLVYPAHAAPSESIVIAQVETGAPSSSAAAQEMTTLFNASSSDVNVTGWCISYSSAGNGSDFSRPACLAPPDDATELWLKAGGYVQFASQDFVDAYPGFVPDVIMSGGYAVSGGHVRLTDSAGQEIDRVGWGTASAPEGLAAVARNQLDSSITRKLDAPDIDTDNNALDFMLATVLVDVPSGLYERTSIVDVCPNVDGLQELMPDGFAWDEGGDCFVDVCQNLEGLQKEMPEGFAYTSEEAAVCDEITLPATALIISELYPNAPSYDTGQEFIELYNPHDEAVDLAAYTLELGPAYTKQFTIQQGVIEPQDFVVFSDIDSGIVLPNTTASVRLRAPNGKIVSETAAYIDPSDDESWVLIDEQWQYSDQITAGGQNLPSLEPVDTPQTAGADRVLAPCPTGQFRNPETNRCKSLTPATSQLIPCDADEYRNPDTNRCRKIVSAVSQLQPCSEGQFRNPETNRCKSIASETNDLVACKEGYERNPDTNRCRKVVSGDVLADVTDIAVEATDGELNWHMPLAVVSGAGGYALFEWRREFLRKLHVLRLKIRR